MIAGTDERGIALLHFFGPDAPSDGDIVEVIRNEDPGSVAEPGVSSPLLNSAKGDISSYIEQRKPLPVIPVDLGKGTQFQQKVWKALRRIPFGETRTYGQIAAEVGKAGAPRAVGQACGRNPIPILVPCHRVVGSNGKPGGYSGGIHIKMALLEIEHEDQHMHRPH
jgi:O-6-methylguanine DNA methyltransferase